MLIRNKTQRDVAVAGVTIPAGQARPVDGRSLSKEGDGNPAIQAMFEQKLLVKEGEDDSDKADAKDEKKAEPAKAAASPTPPPAAKADK